jgi:hypothetical protein
MMCSNSVALEAAGTKRGKLKLRLWKGESEEAYIN